VATGGTQRDHEAAADRIRKQMPAARQKPKQATLTCPPALAHVWGWYLELQAGSSGGGGFGPACVTWSDIGWWAQLTGEMIDPIEARLIIRLANLRERIASEDDKGKDRADRQMG
jgi:hypothetical protein